MVKLGVRTNKPNGKWAASNIETSTVEQDNQQLKMVGQKVSPKRIIAALNFDSSDTQTITHNLEI